MPVTHPAGERRAAKQEAGCAQKGRGKGLGTQQGRAAGTQQDRAWGMGDGGRAGEEKVGRKVPGKEQTAAQTGNKNMFKQRV